MNVADLGREIGQTLRAFRRQPGFILSTLAVLGLGIGGGSLILSVVEAAWLRPLDVPRPEALVSLLERNGAKGVANMPSSPGNAVDYGRELRSLESITAYRQGAVTLTEGDAPLRLPAGLVTPAFFRVFGVAPALGNLPTAPADITEPQVGVVLGYDLWQSRFGGDTAVVGRTLHLDGEPQVVLGVMPKGFAFPNGAQVWCPLRLTPAMWSDHFGHYVRLLGRLAAGNTVADAQAELAALSIHLAERDAANAGWDTVVKRLDAQIAEPLRPAIEVAVGAGVLLLVVACGNVSNLLLARAAFRAREFAVRAALGATRRRLMAHCLLEGTVLAVSGGVLGLAWASFGARLVATSLPDLVPRWRQIAIGPMVATSTLLLAVAVGVVGALAPGYYVAAASLRSTMSRGGIGATRPWRRSRLSRAFAAGQMAVSFVLLLAASLLATSFENLLRLDPGFDPTQVLTMRLQLPGNRYANRIARRVFFENAAEALAAIPGVAHVSAVSSLPLDGRSNLMPFSVLGAESRDETAALFNAVLPGYFETMGIALKAGRDVVPADQTGSPVVLVNDVLAKRYLPGPDPVGATVILGNPATGTRATVVGVVGAVRAQDLESEPGPAVYAPYAQSPFDTMTFCLKARTRAETLAPAVRQAVGKLDRLQATDSIATMEDVTCSSLLNRKLAWVVAAVFAFAATGITTAGVYALLGQSVAEATRELGVRLALGGEPRHLRWLVFVRAAGIAAPGTLLGVFAGLIGSHLLTTQLFGVTAADPRAYLLVTAVLGAATLLAAARPMRRAGRISPATVLRED